MNKIIAIAVLSFASSFAFASDLSLASSSPIVASTSVPAESAKPSSIEDGAAKVGVLIGALFKAPISMGKALVRGIEQGVADKPQATASVPSDAKLAAKALPADASSANSAQVASGFFSPAALIAKLSQRDRNTALAPVEEKSTVALSTEY